MTRRLMAFTVAFAALSIIATTGCNPPFKRVICGPPEERAEVIVKKLKRDLNLTDEQMVQVNRIKDEILARTKPLDNERDAVFHEVLSMVRSEKLDKRRVMEFAMKREAKMKELKPFFIEKLVEFHNLLTPEQREKIASRMEKARKWCGR